MRLRRILTRQSVLGALLLAAAACTFAGPGVAGWLRHRVSYVLAPLGDGAMYLASSARHHADQVGTRAISPQQAAQLMEEIETLRGQLVAMQFERARLQQQLLDIQDIRQQLYSPTRDIPYELIPAHVVGADSLAYGRTRLIDVGSSRGLRTGDPVTTMRLAVDRANALPPNLAAVSASAMVGRIDRTSAFTARLVLLTDRAFRAQALIIRDPGNARTILQTEGQAIEAPLTAENNYPIPCEIRGQGQDQLLIENVKALHNVKAGDWVVTSDSSQPPLTIRIGQVSEVVPQPAHRGLFVNVLVRPHADLRALRDVYVILPLGQWTEGNG